MLQKIVQKMFKADVEGYFKGRQFLELDMEEILNRSLVGFQENADRMSYKVQR